MDIDASKMQDDTQPQSQGASQGAAIKQIKPPSKVVENAFFCYSTPDTIKGAGEAGQTQTVEAALAVFPKSHESFLRAASSLPLKLRGWWKAPVVLVWDWLAAPSATAPAKLTIVVGFDNPSGGFKSRAPDWLGAPKTRDQFRRIIQEGFRRLFPAVLQQVTEVDMQLAEWLQRNAEKFVRLHQIAVPSGKAQEYSELFASVERDVGLISPQYHKGHLEKPPTKPPKPSNTNKKLMDQRSPSKRPAAGEADSLTPSKRPKTAETDAVRSQIVSKTTPTFAKPVVPQRVVYQQQQQQQKSPGGAAPGSPTKQAVKRVPPPTGSASSGGGPPPIIRKKDSPTLSRAPHSK